MTIIKSTNDDGKAKAVNLVKIATNGINSTIYKYSIYKFDKMQTWTSSPKSIVFLVKVEQNR